MIEAINITKKFPVGESELIAVDHANLTIHDNEFIILVGRSGSGKSTLLSMLGGLSRPNEGIVKLNEKDIWNMTDQQLSVLRAEQIGFVFQFPGLMPTLTAMENILLPSLFKEKNGKVMEKAVDLLKAFGIDERRDHLPSRLSGGELKRVAMARALINNPSILFADEPTGDLDVETEMEIMELLSSINKQHKTIILVTHNPELSSYAHRMYKMDKGKLWKVDKI